SSDVCSSDLGVVHLGDEHRQHVGGIRAPLLARARAEQVEGISGSAHAPMLGGRAATLASMSGLVIPPPAAREMHAPHERPPLPPGTRVDTVWIWLIVFVPWVLASAIYLFDAREVLDALWVDDQAAALGHVALHLGLLAGSSVVTIGLALFFAFRDARRLRLVGVVRPFPWGFAAIAGIVYVIGRQVVLRKVTPASAAPL